MECLSLLIPRFVHAWNSIWTSNDSPAILWIMFLHLEVFEWKAPHCEVFCLGVQRSTTLIAWPNHSLSRQLCQACVGSKKETQKHLNFCTETRGCEDQSWEAERWLSHPHQRSWHLQISQPRQSPPFRTEAHQARRLKNCAKVHKPASYTYIIYIYLYTMYVCMYVCT